jgi:DNA mismatch repair protein MutL
LYQEFTQKGQAHLVKPNTPSSLENWQDFFEPLPVTIETESIHASPVLPWKETIQFEQIQCWQLMQTYVLFQAGGSLWIIHQQHAHERVLHEKFTQAMHGKGLAIQRLLFPIPVELSAPDAAMLETMIPDLLQLGFQLEPFGKQTYVIQGIPADLKSGEEKHHIEQLLERVKHFSADLKLDQRERVLRSLAQQQSIKPGQSLSQEEMQTLAAGLFACSNNSTSPSGKPALRQLTAEAFDRIFERLV